MPLLYIRLLVAVGILSLITGAGYLGYSKIKAIGYEEASVKYEKVIKEYQDQVLTKITKIEANSDNLITESRVREVTLGLDISGILTNLKGKTLTIVKDGGCTPSVTFSDSINAINKRVNETVKGTQK